MMVNLLIFGPLKDVTGTDRCQVTDAHDTDEMIRMINEKYPGMSEKVYLVAVENDIIQGNTQLRDNVTVALLPPYSGG
jgi:sulfur-carrier protein